MEPNDLDLLDEEHANARRQPPADWKPDWSRWNNVLDGAKRLKTQNAELQKRLADKEAEALTHKTALEKETERHAAELAEWRDRMEETEIKSIPGLVDPDLGLIRSKYSTAVADIPEAKRPTLADWTKGQIEEVQADPSKGRWLAGYLGQPSAKPAADSKRPAAKPAADLSRRPPPPPRGGWTEEAIANLTPEQFKAYQADILASINQGG